MKKILCSSVLTTILLALAACSSSPTRPGVLPSLDDVVTMGTSTLVFDEARDLGEQRGRIEELVRDTYTAARALLPLERVTVIVETSTALVIPEIGVGGRADDGTVRMGIDTNSPAWPAALETDFAAVLAHELHHVARLRTVGFTDNLLEAVVLEGLADHFSTELLATPPAIWATALHEPALTDSIERARETWLDSPYDHDAWFFGTTAEIPRWAGYSIGYELVRRHLAANPAATPSSLYGEPAETFAAR